MPYFGICLGHALRGDGIRQERLRADGANSTEFEPDTQHPVIDLLPEQKSIVNMGGTMRLGGYDCHLVEGSRAHQVYGTTEVRERHRHRYEYNNDYRETLESKGLASSGIFREVDLVEMVELPDHPWFVAVSSIRSSGRVRAWRTRSSGSSSGPRSSTGD